MRLQRTIPYAVPIMMGAFLLFQIQLIIAKYILPWFGGTPSVWTTCMLVFQLLLLAGYLYAHIISMKLTLRIQARIHILLLLFSVALLAANAFLWKSPITPEAHFDAGYTSQPIRQIIRILAVSISLPFFLLSTTSPLLQRWYAATHNRQPYRLYALSNIGSLAGLVSYPFLLEPLLTTSGQGWIWSVCYAVFAGMCLISAHKTSASAAKMPALPAPKAEVDGPGPEPARMLLWLLLSGCACAMFLATTNMICQEIAVIPLLWVLPLGLYLISFIACFDSSRWYRRVVFHPLYFISFVILMMSGFFKILPAVGSHLLMLFAVAMICHGELVAIKPASRHLTSFYLMVAAGGALGGVFVTLVAPFIFPAFWELQLAVLECGLLLALVLNLDRESWFYRGSSWLPFLLVCGVAGVAEFAVPHMPALQSLSLSKTTVRAVLAILGIAAFWRGIKGKKGGCESWIKGFSFGILALVGAFCFMHARYQGSQSSILFRSFFGAFRIEENDQGRTLKHGQTTHGWQFHDGLLDPTPTSYYATNTGIGILLWNHPKRTLTGPGSDLRVGVVGLGVGTLAAYVREQDYYRFYEIDPKILQLSEGPNPVFSFLQLAPAKVDVVLGDARQSLAAEAARGEFQRFDVLVLDAFSSDSIPVHLLTKEAMQLYLRHLRGPESVVAFHVSNRTLDLDPVLRGLSQEFDLDLSIIDTEADYIASAASWGLLSRDRKVLHTDELERHARKDIKEISPVIWRDDFSNLFRLIKRTAWW